MPMYFYLSHENLRQIRSYLIGLVLLFVQPRLGSSRLKADEVKVFFNACQSSLVVFFVDLRTEENIAKGAVLLVYLIDVLLVT